MNKKNSSSARLKTQSAEPNPILEDDLKAVMDEYPGIFDLVDLSEDSLADIPELRVVADKLLKQKKASNTERPRS